MTADDVEAVRELIEGRRVVVEGGAAPLEGRDRGRAVPALERERAQHGVGDAIGRIDGDNPFDRSLRLGPPGAVLDLRGALQRRDGLRFDVERLVVCRQRLGGPLQSGERKTLERPQACIDGSPR